MFTGAYVEEVYESEHVRTDTKRLCVILYAKYEKEDSHKDMETQCRHLTMTQCNGMIKLLQRFEEFFSGTIVTWKTDPVDLKLKGDVTPICLQPYPVPNVHEEMFKNEIEHLFLLGVLEVAND